MRTCLHYCLIVNAAADSDAIIAHPIAASTPDTQAIQSRQQARLPYFEVPYHFWQICEPANAAITQAWQIPTTTLRCVSVGVMPTDSEEKQAEDTVPQLYYVYLMQTVTEILPQPLQWTSSDRLQLHDLPFSVDDIQTWLTTLDEEHPYRPEWYRPRWQQTIQQTIPHATQQQQVRSWERSTIWRLRSSDTEQSSWRYLKVVPPVFEHEPTLTRWLRMRFPEHTPILLPLEKHRWLLMQDYGGQVLNEIKKLTVWEEAIRAYATLQRQLIPHTDTLRNLGVPQRPLSWIDTHMNALLLNLDSYTIGWDAERKQRLHSSVPRLHRTLARLSSDSIPNTLEHGDFWAGQIIVRRDKTLFTDWSDSTLTHPFFSLPFFLVDIHHELPSESPETIYTRLTDAYLSAWRDFASNDALHTSLTDAMLISPLFTALRYTVDILPRMENKWEMINMVGYNLGLLLNALDKSADQA